MSLLFMTLLVFAGKASAEGYEVTYDQMATGEVLQAGDRFLITIDSYNTSDTCLEIGEDEVGIQLFLGEFVVLWKQMTLSLLEDPDQYRTINELEGAQNSYITIFNLFELVNYRLCFWKDDGDLINPYRNFYMMIDAIDNLLPQHVYNFYWIRDE